MGAAVAITGLGAVSPFGVGMDVLWAGLHCGDHAIGPVRLFSALAHRTHLAGELPPDSLPRPNGAGADRGGRTGAMALAAAREALADAGLLETGGALRGAGLFFGTSTGGLFEGEEAFFRYIEDGADRGRVTGFAVQPGGTPAEHVARELGVAGPTEVVATACAASTLALEGALDALRTGEVELALVGGADGLCQTTFGGFNSLRAVDALPSRPFRTDRQGLSLGEGAAMLILETAERAAARGARVLSWLAGAGSSCDANHMTAPAPEGEGAERAILLALEDAGVRPDEVGFVNAHGSGTPHNDAAEAAALRAVLGPRVAEVPVTSTKGAIGHTLGACGAIEAAVTVRCLLEGVLHPTPGGGEVDPDARVNLVMGKSRAIDPARPALSTNIAFGGANAAVVLRRDLP